MKVLFRSSIFDNLTKPPTYESFTLLSSFPVDPTIDVEEYNDNHVDDKQWRQHRQHNHHLVIF